MAHLTRLPGSTTLEAVQQHAFPSTEMQQKGRGPHYFLVCDGEVSLTFCSKANGRQVVSKPSGAKGEHQNLNLEKCQILLICLD